MSFTKGNTLIFTNNFLIDNFNEKAKENRIRDMFSLVG